VLREVLPAREEALGPVSVVREGSGQIGQRVRSRPLVGCGSPSSCVRLPHAAHLARHHPSRFREAPTSERGGRVSGRTAPDGLRPIGVGPLPPYSGPPNRRPPPRFISTTDPATQPSHHRRTRTAPPWRSNARRRLTDVAFLRPCPDPKLNSGRAGAIGPGSDPNHLQVRRTCLHRAGHPLPDALRSHHRDPIIIAPGRICDRDAGDGSGCRRKRRKRRLVTRGRHPPDDDHTAWPLDDSVQTVD
jgi:hypothetical protein